MNIFRAFNVGCILIFLQVSWKQLLMLGVEQSQKQRMNKFRTMTSNDYTVSSELYAERNNITDIQPTVSKNNVVSTFKFTNPKPATVDKDGDFDVCRKTSSAATNAVVEIEHSTSTALNLVGLQIWRGAFLLADWLIYNSKTLPKDAIVLELGSGVGLTSIVAAMFRPVICTDINQGEILNLLESNVSRNKKMTTNSIKVLELDFFSENFIQDIENILPNVRVILAADVIYDDDITTGFVKTIKKLLIKSPKSAIYVALEKRYVFTIEDCETCAPCYDYFLENLRKLPNVKHELVDLNFPQYFQYDRVKELVLWKIESNFG